MHYPATGAGARGEFGLYRCGFTGPPSGPGARFHKTLPESCYDAPAVTSAFPGGSRPG